MRHRPLTMSMSALHLSQRLIRHGIRSNNSIRGKIKAILPTLIPGSKSGASAKIVESIKLNGEVLDTVRNLVFVPIT